MSAGRREFRLFLALLCSALMLAILLLQCTSALPASGQVASDEVPVGGIIMWGGALVPDGYLEADGSCYDIYAYPQLHMAIGENFGACDGSHHKLPDFSSSAPQGVGGSETLGQIVGTNVLTQVPQHNHAQNIGGAQQYQGGSSTPNRGRFAQSSGTWGALEYTGNSGVAAGVENRGQRLTVRFIIKAVLADLLSTPTPVPTDTPWPTPTSTITPTLTVTPSLGGGLLIGQTVVTSTLPSSYTLATSYVISAGDWAVFGALVFIAVLFSLSLFFQARRGRL